MASISMPIRPIKCPIELVNSVIPSTAAEIDSKSVADSLDVSMSDIAGRLLMAHLKSGCISEIVDLVSSLLIESK